MIVSNCKNPSKIQLSPAAGVMVVMTKDEGDIGLRPLIHGPKDHAATGLYQLSSPFLFEDHHQI